MEGMMTHRGFASLVVAATVAVLGLISVRLIAQGTVGTEAELAATDSWGIEKHRTLARIIQQQIGVKDGWRAPRTAWGHPDLTGAWTSDGVHGIPRERP